jgi:hypothetical protein
MHFRQPSLAAFRTDLDPSRGGRVTVDEWHDYVIVTFEDVPFFGGDPSNINTFQMVLMDDGTLATMYLEIGSDVGGLVGISSGTGGLYPEESDFTDI